MPYGEMQLIAYGSQDLYLTGNPSITFFKAAYKRYTNFATEHIDKQFITSPSFQTTSNTIAKCKIDRNGDLIGDIYLVYDLPNIYSSPKTTYDNNDISIDSTGDSEYFRWIKNIGENIIYKTSLYIDGLLIDEQYGTWMNIWNELTLSSGKRSSYDKITGNISTLNNPVNYNGSLNDDPIAPSINAYRLYIPLPFWFCNNPGLAIPLISLQYNELFIHIEFNPLNYLFTIGGNDPLSPSGIFDDNYIDNFIVNTLDNENTKSLKEKLLDTNSEYNLFWKFITGGVDNIGNLKWNMNTYLDVNYIYLDSDERKKFAQVSQEYLITQLQTQRFLLNNIDNGLKGSNNILNLNLNQPVKEIIWILRRNDIDKRNQWNNYTTSLYDYDFNTNMLNYGSTFSSNIIYPKHPTNNNGYAPNYYKSLYTFKYLTKPVFDSSKDFNNYYQQNPSTSFNQINNIMYSAKLIFNGNERFSTKDNNFFNYLQPYKHHTNTPSPGVNVYSFSLYPEDHQPSGSCNMSRISNVQLDIAIRWLVKIDSSSEDTLLNEGYELLLFGTNYNVLRIMGGMGGLVFAN